MDENISYQIEESGGGFLDDLGADRFVAPMSEKDRKQAEREQKKVLAEQQREAKRYAREQKAYEREMMKQQNQAVKNLPKDEDDGLFDDKGTPIHGADKLVLLRKIKQYKSLFPAELKTFKIKKNPSIKDLQDALDEIEVLIETNNVDEFMMDGVFQSIKMVESVSAMTTNYNVTGMVDLLKMNKQFHQLCKQLFIKYGMFSRVPPEYQMVMIVSTTAYICMNKNKRKAELEDYLNQPIGE